MLETAPEAPTPDFLTPPMPRERWLGLVLQGQLLKLGCFLAMVVMVVMGAATRLDWALFAGMYLVTILGVTGGMHRLFAHRAYQAKAPLRAALALAATLAGQGSVLVWCAIHRQHHQHSDQAQDPHSPEGGLWHSHGGWIFEHYPEGLARYVPDLLEDPWLVKLHVHQVAVYHLGAVGPAAFAFALTGHWQAALAGWVWGGWGRMFAAEQATCAVNSLCHMWGRRPFETRDRSTNFAPVALFTLGEGWHNNHHAFPASARHGLAWWQLDPTYMAIKLWQALGLASRVIVPEPQQLEARRAKPAA